LRDRLARIVDDEDLRRYILLVESGKSMAKRDFSSPSPT